MMFKKMKSIVPWCISAICLLLALYTLMNKHHVAERSLEEIVERATDRVANKRAAQSAAADITPKLGGDATSHDGWRSLFSFVPYGLDKCEDLFENKTAQDFFPDSYLNAIKEHTAYLKNKRFIRVEGHAGSLLQQRMVMWTLARADFVKTVCETGFNAGHSALMWLNAKINLKLYSFDIGRHNYSRSLSDYLVKKYPDRLHLTWGDSTKTLPEFRRQHPDVICDIVFIDGGHTTQIAESDFNNFRSMVTGDNILIFDDFPCPLWNLMAKLGKMWESKKQTGEVIEIFSCLFKNSRGFSVGRYNL